MRLLLLVLPLLLIPLRSAPAAESAPPAARLSPLDAVLLGVVEGVTEYLPISSTGHLIVANRILGLDSRAPLHDATGRPLWHRPPSARNPAGEPLTLKRAADTYTVVIQAGAIVAVALLYWPQLLAMIRGLAGRDPAGLRLTLHLAIAFVPAAVVGLLAGRWIEEHLFSVDAVIAALIAGALLMFGAETWRRRRTPPAGSAGSADLTATRAATIGVLQCVALWPGTSRSMMTIVGGYFAGLDPRRAAEFSFLLGFFTLSAASLYKGWQGGAAMIQVFGWSSILLGMLVAALTAALCVRFLVHWLTRHGLALFAWYRIALAAVLILFCRA